jgi:N-ethylmaleimide reductase
MRDSNPGALFTYVAEQLNQFGLTYLHVVEPRVKGNVTIVKGQGPIAAEQLRKVFNGKIIAAGGFEPETAESAIETGVADTVAFGRHFVANPDLPLRIREGSSLTPYDRDTFYTFDSAGYNDYPFVSELASR